MQLRYLTILLICFPVIILSCGKKIIPEKPLLSSSAAPDSLPLSEINIPIQVNLRPIYALAEKSVDTLFTSLKYPNNWVQEACDIRYKYVFRRGPLQMRTAGLGLTLGFTGYYKIIGSTRVCVGGTAISPWTPPCRCGFDEPERRVNVSFTNSVNVLPDYKIRLSILRNEPQPLDKCEVCFWGQDITNQVLKGLKSELDLAKTELEKNYGIVDLKSRFQQVWDQLNKVYNLYGMGWLQINPRQVRINSLFAKNDSLNVNLGLSARPVISFEKPAEHTSWIPNISTFPAKPGFSIFLDAVLNYDSLSNLLNSQVTGKSFDLDKGPLKKKFIIKQCQLYGGNRDKLVIKVEFTGSDNGVLYLVGKPVYDTEKKKLEIKEIDFDIKSKDALLKAADWLFNKRIINEIEKYAQYDLQSFLDTAKSGLSQQLNRELITGVTSSGVIDDLKLIGIYPGLQHLVIRSNCTGQLAVKVDSIPFTL
jgi:hypothetical protein